MIEPALALQSSIRERLVATSAVTSLVPASAIFDRHERPEAFPCIIIGEAVSDYADRYTSFFDRVFMDLPIWATEPGLIEVKSIAHAIRTTLREDPPLLSVDALAIESSRFFRDPDGVHAHAIMTVQATMMEAA